MPRLLRPAALVLIALFLAATTAWGGPLTLKGTQPPVQHAILTASDCATCHAGYDTTANVEPWDTWAGSMMAQASRDPIFWAALDVAVNDGGEGVGDWCLRCHVPRGWLAGRSEGSADAELGCEMLGNIDEAADEPSDFDGVNCHTCHRMMVNLDPPDGQQQVYSENADFWIDDSSCNGLGEPCRRGPYNYVVENSNPPSHAWAYSAYHVKSDVCGTCHNVTNPTQLLYLDGVESEIPFPIERTFKEWQQSAYSDPSDDLLYKPCQSCHMPDAAGDSVFACDSQANNRAGNLPIHQFAGGNAWVPAVLRAEYPGLDLGTQLLATQNWALDMLQNQSATVEVTIVEPCTVEGLQVDVKVTNHTGHKLPTGYAEGRRMWLEVTARDANGSEFFHSGGYDPATGVLTHDPNISLYHCEQGMWDADAGECAVEDEFGAPMFHFVLNDCIHADTRIPPLGFSGGSDPETQPIGRDYPETFEGSGKLVNYDVRRYNIGVPADSPEGAIEVTARLWYQTSSKEYVDFLRDQAVENDFENDCIPRSGVAPDSTRGEILHGMWKRNGRSAPVDMGHDTETCNLGRELTGAPVTLPPPAMTLRASGGAQARTRTIRFALPAPGEMSLVAYDVAGRSVDRLAVGPWPAGQHSLEWDVSALASGLYFLRLDALAESKIVKLAVIR